MEQRQQRRAQQRREKRWRGGSGAAANNTSLQFNDLIKLVKVLRILYAITTSICIHLTLRQTDTAGGIVEHNNNNRYCALHTNERAYLFSLTSRLTLANANGALSPKRWLPHNALFVCASSCTKLSDGVSPSSSLTH